MNTNGETFVELVKSMFGTQALESVLVKYLIFLGKAEGRHFSRPPATRRIAYFWEMMGR
jgi:hypothetical protein